MYGLKYLPCTQVRGLYYTPHHPVMNLSNRFVRSKEFLREAFYLHCFAIFITATLKVMSHTYHASMCFAIEAITKLVKSNELYYLRRMFWQG
jgi:hypothetical protein